MKYITISIFLSLILLTAAIASAGTTTIEFKPSEIHVNSGDTFNVSLYVTANQVINTVATDLITYDKNVIECLSVQKGDLFPDAVIWIPSTIINQNGTLKNMVWGSQATTNSSGTFCILTFRAKTGTTNIVIDEQNYGVANAGLSLNRSILNSCKVIVAGGGSIIPSVSNISLSPIQIELLVIIIILVILVVAAVIYRRKHPKKPKTSEEKEETHDDDDVFG